MIGREEWWGIIQAYGSGIWPIQVFLYAGALAVAVLLIIRPGRPHALITRLYFSIAFAWNGIAFFLVLAKGITGNIYGSYLFASLFISVSLLFFIDLFRRRMSFTLPERGLRRIAVIALLTAVLCYPVFGTLRGHNLSASLIPGAFPCPTTALALILLTTALPNTNKAACILLLFWAVPFPPFLQIPKYGVYEDAVMLSCGVFSAVLFVRYAQRKTKPAS